MGLDMYLYAETEVSLDEMAGILSDSGWSFDDLLSKNDPEHPGVYVSGWDFAGREENALYEAILDHTGFARESGSPHAHIYPGEDSFRVHVTIAYWRKANAIHAWFVDECQDGVDECQQTEVHPEKLAELDDTCARALAAYEAEDFDRAEKILRPRAGFFFGSYDIDEWWAENLRYTRKALERAVNTAAMLRRPVRFFYQSSW